MLLLKKEKKRRKAIADARTDGRPQREKAAMEGGLLGPGFGAGLNAFVYGLVGLHVLVLVRNTIYPYVSLALYMGGCRFLLLSLSLCASKHTLL